MTKETQKPRQDLQAGYLAQAGQERDNSHRNENRQARGNRLLQKATKGQASS